MVSGRGVTRGLSGGGTGVSKIRISWYPNNSRHATPFKFVSDTIDVGADALVGDVALCAKLFKQVLAVKKDVKKDDSTEDCRQRVGQDFSSSMESTDASTSAASMMQTGRFNLWEDHDRRWNMNLSVDRRVEAPQCSIAARLWRSARHL